MSEKQQQFLDANSFFVCYGGAKGGGKSHVIRLKSVGMCLNYPGIRVLMIRCHYPELEENLVRPILRWLPPEIYSYNGTSHLLTFYNGSVIKFGHYDGDAAENEYQGVEYDVIFIDEATQLSERAFRYLQGCIRGVNDFPKRMYLTCNPGGVGHRWVKRLFIDRNYIVDDENPEKNEDPKNYTFIFATVEDNKYLLDSSPMYLHNLANMPEDQMRAFRYGDWNALSGSYFKNFVPALHIRKAFDVRIMQSRGNANSGYLLIEPATQVADWYMRNASNYIAYSDFSERLAALNRSTAYSPSAADVMSQYFGENGSQWMDKYVDGLGRASKSSEQSAGSKFLKQLRMNLYQGALGLSPTVPLKQLASYWSAADVVGMGNLLLSYRFKILTPAKGHSMQNPVMRSRRRGSIDPTYADIMKNNETAIGRLRSKNKVVNWLAEGISRMDYKVLDNIYTACERAVRQENPKIDVKSDEYRKLVDDKFNLVALRTQSIFAPTVSAEMQRSDSELLKSLSMFRTQQTQDFSRTVKAINEYRNATNKEAKAAAASTLRASVVGSVASSVSLGLMTAAARLLLHKRRDYEDDDGNLDPKLILRNVGFDSAKSLAGMVWFGDEISSAILSAITRGDEKYYGFSLGGLDSVNDALESLTTFSENPSVYNGKRVVGAVSTAFGIPANNVYAMLNPVVMWSLDFTHNNDGSYDDVLKWLHNEAGGNISDFNVDEEKVELTASERHEYKRIFDESEERFSADYAGLPGFASLNERQLKSVFKAMRSYSDYKAKQAILDERGDDRELYRQSWYDLPERKMVQYLAAREQAKALYDDDGNITDYSAMDKWLRESYGTLDAQQKELLGKSGMSRIDDMYQALYQGISSKKYDAAYKLYKKYDESSGSGTVRAEDLKTEIGALGLKKEQAAWLSDNLKLWQHMPIDTDSYDKLVDAGIPDGKANKLRDDMRALPVLAGKSGVTNNQKYAAIMDASYLDDKQKWAAFYTIATDAARKEADKYRAIGYSYDQWLSSSNKYGVIK